MRVLLLVLPVMSIFLSSQFASAALPPLSNSEREELASEIVSGHVLSVELKTTVYLSYGKNAIYEVRLQDCNGNHHSFTYWKSIERPKRWAGPSGQYGEIVPGDYIRAYLTRDPENGALKLLTPNGFDRI